MSTGACDGSPSSSSRTRELYTSPGSGHTPWTRRPLEANHPRRCAPEEFSQVRRLSRSSNGCWFFEPRDNQAMRYVFYNSAGLSPKAVSAAKRSAATHGAKVLRSAPGQLLVQAEPANAAAFARALPTGWQYSVEQNETTLPEPIRRPQSQRGRK